MNNYTEEAKQIYNKVCDKYEHHWLNTTVSQNMAMEMITEALSIANVVKSLPIQDLPKCNRVEVIDQQGRTYINRNPANKVNLSVQDEGRTLKVFID